MNNNIKADIFKALSNPMRLEIIELLYSGEKCVCEIVEKLNYAQPHISKGLKTLKKAGIIKQRKIGLNVYYRLTLLCVKNFLECLNKQL